MTDDLDPRDALRDKLHLYDGAAIDVTYDKARCIHVGACIRGLPRVFDPGSRPWVITGNSTADKIAAAVEQCPSGALHYIRKDGGPGGSARARECLLVSRNGPLFVRGQLELVAADGSVRQETRLALCRCGASAHKPYCDKRTSARFQDESEAHARRERCRPAHADVSRARFASSPSTMARCCSPATCACSTRAGTVRAPPRRQRSVVVATLVPSRFAMEAMTGQASRAAENCPDV